METKSFSNNCLVKLKNNDWLLKQRKAGQCVSKCLQFSKDLIESHHPNLSLLQIESECEKIIQSMDCIPTFFGYKGFPGKICLSVNQQLVHGIPSDYILQDGDVVKIDLGATYQGVIADAAITCIYGTPKNKVHLEMIEVCKNSLYEAIKAIKIGKQLGCIGFAINKYVTSKSNFKLITNYGGHGICITEDGQGIPHASPFVANKSRPNEGIRIQPGLAIAIEPLLVIGNSASTRIGKDNWTVICDDVTCHTEHSVFVDIDGVEILTWREEELIPNKILF